MAAESLEEAVEAAVAAMPWLKDSDAAAVQLALEYARRIDGSGDAKDLYLGPHLLQTLRALGGTPGDRKALQVEEAVHGKLAHLRAVRGGKAS